MSRLSGTFPIAQRRPTRISWAPGRWWPPPRKYPPGRGPGSRGRGTRGLRGRSFVRDVSAGCLLLRFPVRMPFRSVCLVEVYRVLGAGMSQLKVIIAIDRARERFAKVSKFSFLGLVCVCIISINLQGHFHECSISPKPSGLSESCPTERVGRFSALLLLLCCTVNYELGLEGVLW